MSAQRTRSRSFVPGARTSVLALATVAVIAALVLTSDFVSRHAAQTLIARSVQRDLGTANRPEVSVRGTFFLPQVIRGRYDHVSVEVSPIRAGALRIAAVRADLFGVHLPFHDLLVQHDVPILIERSRETASFRYQDLNRYLAATGRPLHVAPVGHHRLGLTGTLTILGKHVSVSAIARLSATRNTITITPTRIDSGVAALDDASRALLGERLTVGLPLDALPFGQVVTGITTGTHALTVRAGGQHIVVSR